MMNRTKLFAYRGRQVLAGVNRETLLFEVDGRVVKMDAVLGDISGEAGLEIVRKNLDRLLCDVERVVAGRLAAAAVFDALPDKGDEFEAHNEEDTPSPES